VINITDRKGRERYPPLVIRTDRNSLQHGSGISQVSQRTGGTLVHQREKLANYRLVY
jgi:hypothetical protein